MPEGLSASEVGKEIADHAKHHGPPHGHERRDRIISILEAVLLSVVTLVAAWSGYSAAKWNTESRFDLARASALRTEANRANLDAESTRDYDATVFNAWFTAFTVGNDEAMAIARRRFRAEFAVAFDAWRATKPETNPNAPKGPTFMPQYRDPGLGRAHALDVRAEKASQEGSSAGETSDNYIRLTVFLASVLFLVGISTHFPLRSVRYGLVGVGAVLLVISLIQLLRLDGPPG